MNPILNHVHDGQAGLTVQDAGETSWTKRGRTVSRGIEILGAFAVGAVVMSFVYTDIRRVSYDRIGVPGYDGWYHTKMAALLPEIGLVDHFPWLRFVYFTREGQDFVSHHTGFHVLLAPFVHLSKYLAGDYAPGARWAISICFGLVVALMYGLLIDKGARWRWLWLSLFLFSGHDFFLRHSYIRAICPSLVFMLTILLLMFRKRYLSAGIAVALYNHLYLGGVIYSPVLVGSYALAHLLQPAHERTFPWKVVAWTATGWLVGILTHPYRSGALEFLYMQVFETGLAPDIDVGNEWQSYGNVWGFFKEQMGITIVVWIIAMLLRLGSQQRCTPRDLTLVILNFVFLALTIKAKRFIEYSPVFCLLSAAFLAAPVVHRWADWFEQPDANSKLRSRLARTGFIVLFLVVVLTLAFRRGFDPRIATILVEWPMTTVLAAVLILAPVLRIWLRNPDQLGGPTAFTIAIVAIPCSGAIIKALLQVVFQWGYDVPSARDAQLPVSYIVTVFLSVLYLGAVIIVARCAWRRTFAGPLRPRVIQNVNVLLATTAIVAGLMTFAGPTLVRAQEVSWCGYDLQAIRKMMAYLKEDSKPGDVIFTDDWDVFPVFFYHNSHNYYVVGLDPKFTQSRQPGLWERYVRITRAQTPFNSSIKIRSDRGGLVTENLDIRLEDIRTHFGANYIITDQDHKHLGRQLLSRPDFAKLIYPPQPTTVWEDLPYLVFKVRNEPSHENTHGHAKSLHIHPKFIPPAMNRRDHPFRRPINVQSLTTNPFPRR